MITHRKNTDNPHQLRGRLRVIPSDAVGGGPDNLQEEIEINLASSSSFSLLSGTGSPSGSGFLWGPSPPPSPSPAATAPPSSPTHLGIWTSTTPRPTDEEFLQGDDDDDDDDDEHYEEKNDNYHHYPGDSALRSISDEVMLSRTGSMMSVDVGVGPNSCNNDNDVVSEPWDPQQLLLQSASSCCAAAGSGEDGDDDDDNGDDKDNCDNQDERRDAVQDILQSASSLLVQIAEATSSSVTAAGSGASSPMLGIECLTIPLGGDGEKATASEGTSFVGQLASVRLGTASPVSSAPPSTTPPVADHGDGDDDSGSDSDDDDDDDDDAGSSDSPISRYRKEAEARHRRDKAVDDSELEKHELLSARIAAAATATPTTAPMMTPVPNSSFYGLPPPHLSLMTTTLPPSVRVPMLSNSASATPINNMSPLSLDSSSYPRFLLGTGGSGLGRPGPGGSYAAEGGASQPPTPNPIPDNENEDASDAQRRTTRQRHQELLYFDDMMLLPPTPNNNNDDNEDDDHGEGEADGNNKDDDGVAHDGDEARGQDLGAGAKKENVASQRPPPPPPPPPPPLPTGTRSGHHRGRGGGGGRRLHLPQRNHPPGQGGPPPAPNESAKRHDDVGPSLVDADEEDDEVDDETAAEDNNNDDDEDHEVESAMGQQRGTRGEERAPSEDDDVAPTVRRSDDGDSNDREERRSLHIERRDPSSGSTAGTDPSSAIRHDRRRALPVPPDWEEKKEALELPTLRESGDVVVDDDDDEAEKPDRLRANSPPVQYRFAPERDLPLSNRRPRYPPTRSASTGDLSPLDVEKTLSMTESDVGSLDGLPSSLKSRWGNDFSRSEREALQRIDGVSSVVAKRSLRRAPTPDATSATLRPFKGDLLKKPGATTNATSHPPPLSKTPSRPPLKPSESFSFFSNWPLKLLWDDNDDNDATKEQTQPASGLSNSACFRQEEEEDGMRSRFRWRNEDDSLALLACANLIHHRPAAAAPTTLIRGSDDAPLLSFCQTYNPSNQNRMPAWVEHQFRTRDKSTKDGQFLLGTSRAVIVHEIVRGNWTWATAWSPDGSHLAVATENHHLAVLDTRSSTVWRVRHDKKLQGPVKQGTTHSIRSIAWGKDFIAIGGTGNAVSIISPLEPYTVLQTIPNCGFVGSLDWRPNSNDLVIGSRLDRAMIVRVRTATSTPTPGPCSGTIDAISSLFPQVSVLCETMYTVEGKHWVNAVAYSHSGRYLAIGDAGGTLVVYDLHEADLLKHDAPMDESKELVGLLKSFTMDDSILAVEWSPDGNWLYAGGEDFAVSVVDTEHWEIVHKIKRDRWVQCIAASRSGTHVAVGGVSSEVSLLETKNGWDSVMGMELNGLVPLSAKWHPRDQFLSLTGQNNSILVVETTNARHVRGHHLHSVGGILAVEFSPDGRIAAVGNESGVVTFYSLSGSSFVTSYELVVMVENDRLSIQWSRNGLFVVIATRESLLIVGRKRRDRYGKAIPPKCSGFSIRKVVKDLKGCNAVSIDLQSQYVAVAGSKGTAILDVSRDFAAIREWPSGPCYAAAWSPLGRWLATIGKDKVLTIYDTGEERVDRWRPVFSVTCDYVGRALAWGPLIVGGLLYLAYAGDGNEINVMEIRTQEGTWETILRIQRPGAINALDWHMDGLLAAALSNGTVSIVDLAYLQSGVAVNEMDYNWQRQALTSFTEIRRNRGSNLMRAVRWIPSAPGSDSLLAVGGSDGELEIVDLTERQRCRGYAE